MEHIVIFITCANTEEADKLAQNLVEEKLVACVNTVSEIQSKYWWEKKIDDSQEVFIMAKTIKAKLDDVIKRVKKIHSYDVPEIIALPIVGGNSDYLKWIEESVE